MHSLQRLFLTILRSSLWPAYFGLISVVWRMGPWPHSLGRPAAFIFSVLAVSIFVTSMLRWVFRADGWVHRVFELPDDVMHQLRMAKYVLIAGATAALLPEELLSRGLITSSGRPIVTTTICHLLIIGFEILVFFVMMRLLRRGGPLGLWLKTSPEQLGWVGRHPRTLWLTLMTISAGVVFLEVRGYGFTARRFALAGAQLLILVGICWTLHRFALSVIAQQSWRWIRREAANIAANETETSLRSNDLPIRVRHLADWGVPILGSLIGIVILDVDLALFNSVGEQPLWTIARDASGTVTEAIKIGDAFTATLFFIVTAVAWRYLSTIFVLVIYPRMPEDPGIRFAVLTLCRYIVLALGTMAGLSCLHLGLDKIGMVLAALGVGLGFGLQEIVSNFVSGIILLLERPIRVGDIVTVASMTGKIDRINIRATTLINSDNQCLIIPNREFITGNLVNWTHKDKIIRFTIHINVALGSDPDKVTSQLLDIARADSDVLGTPAPSAFFDSFGTSHLAFILNVHVPDPGLCDKVKHRLCTQIQRRFAEAGISLSLPLHELRVDTQTIEDMLKASGIRTDGPESVPNAPHFSSIPDQARTRGGLVIRAEDI